MLNIMRRLAARYLTLLVISILFLTGFELLIPAVISTLNMPDLLGGVLSLLPPMVGTTLSEQIFGGMSAIGLLGFGWNHPIAHALGTAVAVVLGARAVAGESDNGTLELVLAQPISRTSYLVAHVGFALLALAMLCAIGVLGTYAGVQLFGISAVPMARIALVALNFYLLLCAWYAVTLLASVFAREGGRALGAGVFLAVLSFLVFTIALLWPDAAFTAPYTLHNYYVPRDVLANGSIAAVSLLVLMGCSVICLGLAFWRFARRDIS